MGDIADYYLENCFTEDDNGFFDAYDFLELSDEELKKGCLRSRSKKIMGIVRFADKLSDRQRYCLAVWASQHQDGLS